MKTTLDIRYYGETHCKLKCKNCYLGFSDQPNIKRHFNFNEYNNLSINHYINLQNTLIDTEILFYKDLENIKSLYCSNPKQTHFYSLITDISTYTYLARDSFILNKSLEGLNPTFSLSFKKKSDLNYLYLPHFQSRKSFAFSFIHDLDDPKWFSPLLNHCIKTNNYLTLMFNKPVTFSKESLQQLMLFYTKYPTVVSIDSCISKLINNFDCTKNENNNHFLDMEVDIQNTNFYRCAYTKNECIVSLDNKNYKQLIVKDIDYILNS